MPSTAVNQVAGTELQQSIFNAPPSSTSLGAHTPASLSRPSEAQPNEPNVDGKEPHGMKRGRDEESDDEGAPMEEDESDAPMEASSDEE